eukprot:6966261-Ditylum_brightwellii.AAC.1
MDMFFSTKKAVKSSQENNCCQLFVTDKGFIHAILMKTRSDVMQAVKEFTNVVGAPGAIICDAAREQKSESLK